MTQTTAFPVWIPAERLTFTGLFTAEQQAIADSETVNSRLAAVEELRARLADAETEGRATAGMLRRSLARATNIVEHSLTHCTNSGALRTECTTCNHTRQLDLLVGQV